MKIEYLKNKKLHIMIHGPFLSVSCFRTHAVLSSFSIANVDVPRSMFHDSSAIGSAGI